MTPVTLKMLRCSFSSLSDQPQQRETPTCLLKNQLNPGWGTKTTTKNSVSKEHQTMALPISIQGFYTIVLIIFVRSTGISL